MSAREIESIVLRALRERYPEQDALDDRTVITGSVDRIVLRDAALDITLLIDTESATDAVDDPDKEGYCSAPAPALTVTWKRLAARRRREIIESSSEVSAPSVPRPERRLCDSARQFSRHPLYPTGFPRPSSSGWSRSDVGLRVQWPPSGSPLVGNLPGHVSA